MVLTVELCLPGGVRDGPENSEHKEHARNKRLQLPRDEETALDEGSCKVKSQGQVSMSYSNVLTTFLSLMATK